MIKYVCHNCNDLECETSVCPVCGSRAVVKEVSFYYCHHCNVPCFDDVCPVCGEKTEYIGTDVRPVFPEERLLLEVLLDQPMAFKDDSVWCIGASLYLINGIKKHVSLSDFRKKDPAEIRKKLTQYSFENGELSKNFDTSKTIERFVKANKRRLASISDEARSYIVSRSKEYSTGEMFVSFSGGKDSTITSDLVMKALGTESIVHIYGDTTLEYPSTHDYINRFRLAHPSTPVLVARNNDQDFNDLCVKIGPPSRVMRWCCTVFKTGAITKTIEGTFGSLPKVLTFFGLRRMESKSRSNYERDTDDSKIKRQSVASPIIDWTTFDDWLYILGNHLDFNDAYRLGFSRVGCWCCPNNSEWSGFLSSVYMPEEFGKFQNILYDFAKRVGKKDWKTYIDEGMWKARQGGNGLDLAKNTVVEFKPCAFDEKAINFDLVRPIDERLYVLFKPFGILNFDMGNKDLGEVYVLDAVTKQPILQLRGKVGTKHLRVAILSNKGKFKVQKMAELLVSDQITKFQTCIACGACQSVCPFGAIFVKNLATGDVSTESVQYEINPDKCRHCLECVAHFDSGCYMKKVLRVKNGK
jgi:phosphoadenosine phosphosulfate reductase